MTLPDLRVTLLGPSLKEEIVGIQAFNEILYIATGKSVDIYHFLHRVA